MDKAWLDMVCQSALGWRSSVETTYDVCRTALERGIPGDFVECGVYAGAQAAVMAMALIDHARLDQPFKRVHLFDTFNGIPAAGPEDSEFIEAKVPAGASACSLGELRDNMHRWGIPERMLIYHAGLFEDTWHQLRGQRIAVLRLDGDLYSSTKTCMEHIYPLVEPGGYVIVDDYNLAGCRQAIHETMVPAPIYFRRPNNEPSGAR